jgi:glycosyltransferase involved in cell wall biosynthesis
MRTLIVASDKGSLTNFREELIRELVRRGSQVYAAAPGLDENAREAADLEILGATPEQVHHLRRNSIAMLSDLRALIELCCLIWRVKPNVIILYTPKPVIYGLLAARLLRVPKRVALITGLGYSFIESGAADYKRRLIKRVVSMLYRISLAGATKVLFQNPDDRRSFIAQGIVGRSASTGVVNGSGVNLSKFYPGAIPAGKPSFLMVARILYDKGVGEYILAAARLKRVFPGVDAVLAGPLDSNPGAITETELAGLLSGSGVRYVGAVAAPDIRSLIAACHVFVLPSYREGTPRTVLEAMAVGRPIVTTDVPGCRETVREAFNGYLVPARSAEKLEEAMRRFLSDPALIETMGENSLRLVREKYDVDKVNASILREIGL